MVTKYPLNTENLMQVEWWMEIFLTISENQYVLFFSFLDYFIMISASGMSNDQDSRRTHQEQCNYVVLLAALEGSNIHVQ